MNWACENNLRLANEPDDKEGSAMWIFESNLDTRRQIEFIFADDKSKILDARASDDLNLGSGHRCISSIIQYVRKSYIFGR